MVSSSISRALLSTLLLTASGFSQNTGANVSGTVIDPSGGVVPAARVEAHNLVTGIVSSTLTNEAGVYAFANLNPGTYQVSAAHPGFQKYVLNDLTLEVGAKLTLNLSLKVGTATETVEVEAAAAQQVGYSTSSVGTVINARRVLELPIAGRNALDLLRTQPGVSGPNGGQNFNGARSGSLNVTIDGNNVQDNLLNALSYTNVATSISVDRVEEFRVVTSPADAELGRGSGQIMAMTRSGGNSFHGSLFNEHRDRSLNANSFFNNLRSQPRDRLIRNFFGGRIGGPVKKNRTFFNFFYEERLERFSQTVTSTVLTAPARSGLWRFYPGVRNGNANAAVPTVDLNGNPVTPVGATGDLQTVSVFGRDPNRPAIDPSGAVQTQLALMPLPNDFRSGDGLNTAGYTWNRPRPYNFNQFDIRVDHQFTSQHRASFVYSDQGSQSTNFIGAQRYPTVPGGQSPNSTASESFTLTSIFRPNLLSEFHAGVFRPTQTYQAPWTVAGTGVLPKIGNQPYLMGMSLANSPINTSVGDDPSTRTSPVYQASESLSWIKGRHNFKGGFEARYVSSAGYDTFNTMPRVSLGAGGVPVQNITTIAGLGQNTGAQTLLTDLAGSVASVTQVFNSTVGANAVFLPGLTRYQHLRAPEYSGFFKDDFHVSPSLTLNLGVRYELYAVPTENTGRGLALQNGSAGLFGISGTDFGALFHPGATGGSVTTVRPIGPGTANPDERYFAGDHNNFGPAIGLAWRLPWLGANKTVLRAGYGIGYERNPLFLFSTVSGQEPGYSTLAALVPSTRTDLSNLPLPLSPALAPLAPVGFTDRTSSAFSFDSHLRTPYYQNFNVSLSRELSQNMLLDLRWVANKGTKLIQDANINEVNILENGILNAFQITQRGGNAPLFDTIFAGISGVGTTISGSDLVRSPNGGMQGFLANNDVGGFANFLNTTTQITGQPGGLLRRVGLPENFVVANPQFGPAMLTSNLGSSTWQAFEAEFSRRFASGWTLQASYTFSKALGNYEGDDSALGRNFRTLRDRSLDKTVLSFDRTHALKASGIWELPFGPGKTFGRNLHGVIGQILGGWQTGGILTAQSGAPFSLSGVGAFNTAGNNTAVSVAALPADLGTVQKVGSGVIYFGDWKQIVDPYVTQITTLGGVQQRSTMLAVTDASDKLILTNAQPGQLGTLRTNFLRGPGLFQIDLNLVKRIKFKERYEFHVRADAINFMNHANFSNPDGNIDSTTFGRITGTSVDPRVIVLAGRLTF
jgi:hypothetical protein